jgi:hypothetical protein
MGKILALEERISEWDEVREEYAWIKVRMA